MIKILVDTLGGDKSPTVNIEGAIKAINEIDDIEIIFVGDEAKINDELSKLEYDKKRVSIVHAPDEITCNDKPTDAIRHKTNSSLYKSFELLKNDESVNALVSIGSTGAILAGAVMKIGRIKGVKRPAFCPLLPTMNHGIVGVCDSGANVDCTPLYLQQFAIMGSLYMEKAYGIKNPKTALLNVGTEEEKGDLLRKETYQLLKETDIHPIIIEESEFIGGISRTAEYKGNRMDLGGHRFFSKNEQVNDIWKELMPLQGAPAKDDLMLGREKPLAEGGPDPEQTDEVSLIRTRVSRIFFLRKFFDYPISMKPETFINMGFVRTMKAGFGYLYSCVVKRKENSLEDFYINRFGRPLYSMFFEDYTEKLWGVHPSKIAPDW